MSRHFWLMSIVCLLCLCTAALASTALATPDTEVSLRLKLASLETALRQSPFKQPLVLDSAETRSGVKGDIYATVDYPFDTVSTALSSADNWCEVMLLHINTKYCHAVVAPAGTTLRLYVGKKTPQLLAAAARADFHYQVVAATSEYLAITLTARDGPLGTSDYRIELQAIALPGGKTFLHLGYSYAVNFGAALALQAFLGTAGSAKVGFTVVGHQADGLPDFIGGMRGLLERNTMRYYLAIDSFLRTVTMPPTAQLESRLQGWFTATERYPRQLHEIDRAAYLAMKLEEHSRQQALR